MKKSFLYLLLLPFLTNAQEINFEKGTWKETLAKSKAQNKPIFVDLFQTRSHPKDERQFYQF
jgi:hypothetical protein